MNSNSKPFCLFKVKYIFSVSAYVFTIYIYIHLHIYTHMYIYFIYSLVSINTFCYTISPENTIYIDINIENRERKFKLL